MATIEYKITLKPWAKCWIYSCFFLTFGKKVWLPKFLFSMERV